jgi:hypothetical protein
LKQKNGLLQKTISFPLILICHPLHRRGMAEPKNGRPIFFPENLVLFGNLALFVWIVLDTVAFLLFDLTVGIVFFVLTLILIYGVLHILGCLRPCYNCIKCTHGMGRLAALYFGRRIFKDYKYSYKLPTAIFFTLYIGAFPAAFALYSAIIDFTAVKAAVSVALLALTVYSGLTWRPKKPKNPVEPAKTP